MTKGPVGRWRMNLASRADARHPRTMENLVVVGVDDSLASLAALEWGADYARMTDYRLAAVHVLPTVPASPDFVVVGPSSTVSAMFVSVVPEPEWRLMQVCGRPGEVLVQQSESAVLLVLGHHQATSPQPAENSVGGYCLRHSKAPVLCHPLAADFTDEVTELAVEGRRS
jgi:nucleotide-binding universal stress UspA family protein